MKVIESSYLDPRKLQKRIPGLRKDLTNQEQAQIMATYGKKVLGSITSIAANAVTPIQVPISGTAKQMLGFGFLEKDQDDALVNATLSLYVNNEKVINEAPLTAFRIDSGIRVYAFEYYKFERMMTGMDNIRFEINSDAASTLYLAFYYI